MKKSFIDRINDLKQDIVGSIITIFKENNLTELEFPEELEDRTYVVWFDDDGNVYETTVDKISLCEDLTGEGISIDVHDEDSNCSDTLYYHDLGLQNLYWLVNLREDIIETLTIDRELYPERDDPKESFVFIYPTERFERNVNSQKIIADWDNGGDSELRTRKFTPDEFAEFINDECFSDTCYWVRIISI